MPPTDNSDNDSHPEQICRLEWLVWAIDAAHRHCDAGLPPVQGEEPPSDCERPGVPI